MSQTMPPPVFDPATHSVRIPESLRKSYRAFMDAEYYRLSLPAELGGTGAPRSLNWAMAELILGSNPAIWMYASGHTMARVLWELGVHRLTFRALRARCGGMSPSVRTVGSSVPSIMWNRSMNSSSISRRWQMTSLADQFRSSGRRDSASSVCPWMALTRSSGVRPRRCSRCSTV